MNLIQIFRGPTFHLALIVGALSAGLAGCGRKAPETPPPATNTARTVPAPAAPEDAAALQGIVSGSQPASEADLAWQALERSMQTPEISAELLLSDPNADALNDLMKERVATAMKAADLARDFYRKFPKDGRAAPARQMEIQLLANASESDDTNTIARLVAAEAALLDDPATPADTRLELRLQRIQRELTHDMKTNRAGALSSLELKTRALVKEFPDRLEVRALLLPVASMTLEHGQTAKARQLAGEIVASDLPDDLKQEARSILKRADRVGQPLEIKFAALDGKEIDLQSLKGKVVLVDFWATWCGPCMAELPKVKELYEKLHPRGFEIIGISLDQERDALEQTIAEKKIPWPQYHEVGGDNRFATEFGIESIPTLWLVDKKGLLRHLNASEDLEGKVTALLAE